MKLFKIVFLVIVLISSCRKNIEEIVYKNKGINEELIEYCKKRNKEKL